MKLLFNNPASRWAQKEYPVLLGIQALADLIYPPCCPACGNVLIRNERAICIHCLQSLPRTQFHLDPENEVAALLWGRFPFQYATAFIYFQKGSRYQNILHAIKYRGQKELGYHMGRLFGLELRDSPFAAVTLVHPVPLHPRKMRQRGYNQSEWIARGVAEALQVRFETSLLIRTENTVSQTSKNRFDRYRNVSGAFSVKKMSGIEKEHLLLIDDVITTGATLEACADALRKEAGLQLSIAALAYAKLY